MIRNISACSTCKGSRAVDAGVFHVVSPGCADGIRVDRGANLWSSAADGVHCIAPDGHLMGRILVPETVSNLCFCGRAKHQLFITATTSVYAITLNRIGL
jgi:gluconolactonase